MKDRVPQNPGRMLITPENGIAPYFAKVERADNPVEAGTPMNKAALLKDATATALGLSTTAVPDDALKKLMLPRGIIVNWSGAANAIPSGWALCNGQNGTPNLLNKFVVAAGSSYSVGAQGGAATHTLTVAELPRHSHDIYSAQNGAGATVQPGSYPRDSNRILDNTSSVGGGQSHNNMPPYYALCYIMKL